MEPLHFEQAAASTGTGSVQPKQRQRAGASSRACRTALKSDQESQAAQIDRDRRWRSSIRYRERRPPEGREEIRGCYKGRHEQHRMAAGDDGFGRSRSGPGDVEAGAALAAAAGGRRFICAMTAAGAKRSVMRSPCRQHFAARQQRRAQPHGKPGRHKPSPPAFRCTVAHQSEILIHRFCLWWSMHCGRIVPCSLDRILIQVNPHLTARLRRCNAPVMPTTVANCYLADWLATSPNAPRQMNDFEA